MKAVLLAAESSANCVETFRSLQVVGVLAVGVSEGGDDGVAELVGDDQCARLADVMASVSSAAAMLSSVMMMLGVPPSCEPGLAKGLDS